MTLIEIVEAHIREHGSLRAAARKLKMDPGYLSKLRYGFKKNPGPVTMARLGITRVETFTPAAPAPVIPESPEAKFGWLTIERRPLLVDGMLAARADGGATILIDSEADERTQRVALWHEVLHLIREAEGQPHDEVAIDKDAQKIAAALESDGAAAHAALSMERRGYVWSGPEQGWVGHGDTERLEVIVEQCWTLREFDDGAGALGWRVYKDGFVIGEAVGDDSFRKAIDAALF